MSETADLGRRKRRTMWWLTLLAVGMFGFGFAMVPLYGLLCNITGMQSVDGMSDLGRRMATAGVGGAEKKKTKKK